MLRFFERINEVYFHILRVLLLISVPALYIGLEHSQHLLAVIPITLVIFILLIETYLYKKDKFFSVLIQSMIQLSIIIIFLLYKAL